MSRVCEICGKGPSVGNVVVRKGSPKYKGGIGLHTTGITKRGNTKRMTVCARCIKAGKVVKATRAAKKK